MKKKYLTPKITTLQVMVEGGFQASNEGEIEIALFENECYQEANNSGTGFWGGNDDGSGETTESFGYFDWNW